MHFFPSQPSPMSSSPRCKPPCNARHHREHLDGTASTPLRLGQCLLIFPRFHGHAVKTVAPSPRTRRGNDSRVWSAGESDYRTLRATRRCPALLLPVSYNVDEIPTPFSAYGKSSRRRHYPSSFRGDSCSP